jgi:hypothetical protein
MPTEDQDKKKEARIDIEKILLPKKEGPSPTSATRINAGALLEQEQRAAQGAMAGAAQPRSATPASAQEATRSGAAPAGAPPKEDPFVKPLETYKAAIEEAVQKKNVSVVSIAAAEAQRRAEAGSTNTETSAPAQPAPDGSHQLGITISAIVGGVVLLAAAVGLIAFIVLLPRSAAPVQQAIASPFIGVDTTNVISIPIQQWQRVVVMSQLELARENTNLSLGLISRLLPVEASSSEEQYSVDAPALLQLLAPNAPPELARSLTGQYLLGVHSFDGNQAFLILGVENYEQAYSAMLGWETNMQSDLAPLFTRTPRPHIPEEDVTPAPAAPVFLPSASSTATTSPQTSPPAPATSTASTTPEEPPYVPPPRFIDRVVENRDTRVIQNNAGDILLLWTFLDHSTLLITTNEYTLREVISRISRPPVIPLSH